MAKLTLNDVASLEAQTAAIQTINDNSALIEAALENTLSRDGTSPNQMESHLDMNSNRITNLPAPAASNDAARLIDISEALSVDATLLPALSTDKVLSNDGSVLVWRSAAELTGFGDLISTNNLSDLDNAATARTNLALGTAAVEDIGTSGDALGKLDANLTWSGTQTWSNTATFTGGGFLGGTAEYRLTATPTTLSVDSVGYRGAPLSTHDANYTFVMTDSGGLHMHTSATAHAWTIPPNSSVAYPNGTIMLLHNFGSGVVTLTRGSGVTLRIAGSGTSVDAALAQHSMATLVKVASNTWYVQGTGVS